MVVNEFASDSPLIDRTMAEQIVKHLQQEAGRRQISHELRVRNVPIPDSDETDPTSKKKSSDGGGDRGTHNAHCRLLRTRLDTFLAKMKEDSDSSSQSFDLTSVLQLQNTYRGSLPCHVFGFMGRDRSKLRQYWLEDDSGRVELTWATNVQRRSVLLLENTFVLVEGVYHSLANQLLVERIGYLPPAVVYPQSMIEPSPIDSTAANQSEANMFVLLRDVHLDKREVLSKLQILFAGFDAVNPTPHFFVMIGPFASRTLPTNVHRDLLRLLLKLICSCTNLPQRSHFVLVPGPSDSKTSSTWYEFLKFIFSNLNLLIFFFLNVFLLCFLLLSKPYATPEELLPENSPLKLHLTTNPVHLFVDEQQICVFSGEYLEAARKRTIFSQSLPNDQIQTELLKLLPSNAYLLPSHHNHSNSSLALHTLPDLLLFNEKSLCSDSDPIDMQLTPRSHLLSLPSFTNDQYRFKVFYPETRTIEHSQITV